MPEPEGEILGVHDGEEAFLEGRPNERALKGTSSAPYPRPAAPVTSTCTVDSLLARGPPDGTMSPAVRSDTHMGDRNVHGATPTRVYAENILIEQPRDSAPRARSDKTASASGGIRARRSRDSAVPPQSQRRDEQRPQTQFSNAREADSLIDSVVAPQSTIPQLQRTQDAITSPRPENGPITSPQSALQCDGPTSSLHGGHHETRSPARSRARATAP